MVRQRKADSLWYAILSPTFPPKYDDFQITFYRTRLINAAITDSTLKLYKAAWEKFRKFESFDLKIGL